VWAIVVFGLQSTLKAVPTIEIFSEIQSTGIPAAGIVLEPPGIAPPWGDEENLEESLRAGVREMLWHSDFFEKSCTAAALGLTLGLRYDLDPLVIVAMPPTRASADSIVASGIFRTGMAPLPNNDGL